VRFLVLALLLPLAPAAVLAQVAPTPSFDDPRLQTVAYDPARPVRLVAYPGANLTVMLLPGEAITQTVLSDPGAFDVRVAGPRDSLNIVPLRPGAVARLIVDTSQRRYEFDLETGDGLAAAYVVRFVDPAAPRFAQAASPAALTGEYRLTGEPMLLPSKIADDGERTYIEWGKHQSLPAVFGIGTAGEEEVVDGYMRDGVFTIDRVYGELVFRVDKKRARARRREGLGQG
jgi:type IV secretion system protein VirB9